MLLAYFHVIFILFYAFTFEIILCLRKSFQLPPTSARDEEYTTQDLGVKLKQLLDEKLTPIQEQLHTIQKVLNIDKHDPSQSNNDSPQDASNLGNSQPNEFVNNDPSQHDGPINKETDQSYATDEIQNNSRFAQKFYSRGLSNLLKDRQDLQNNYPSQYEAMSFGQQHQRNDVWNPNIEIPSETLAQSQMANQLRFSAPPLSPYPQTFYQQPIYRY
ncbi:uncharacterized protein LOC128882959 isoform X2 [Hylaeus volcanicus]|uniref:uncharacterized protein LOC128882959 isoform X2 n=1 Tax=Hylaeus volcanicus TaxID=313075 RepID=UPI0023B7D440|nr:uncharacterized protein LOC128882959 isoform X2 [Hylaeus volcanicus]